MKTLNVVGSGAVDLIERLVPRIDGRVATVEHLTASDARDPPTAGAAFGLSADGSWVGAGDDLTLDELLDDLAPDYDYALLAGFESPRLPTVVLGDARSPEDALLSAPDAEAVDLDALLERLAATEPRVTLDSLVSRVKAEPDADRAGAIATFTGRVRAKDAEDDPRTTHLEFEKYEDVAARRMTTLRDELENRDGVFAVAMHHRTGRIEDGEDIVFVVVLAGHREEAFRTVEDGINRLKEEVPIFKKETTVESEFWVHDRE